MRFPRQQPFLLAAHYIFELLANVSKQFVANRKKFKYDLQTFAILNARLEGRIITEYLRLPRDMIFSPGEAVREGAYLCTAALPWQGSDI